MAVTSPLVSGLFGSLPKGLATAVEVEYKAVSQHFLLGEWDDLQVDAGRFTEAVLRVLEWYDSGAFTPIDGKSKPDRSKTVNAARQNVTLALALRQQIPMMCELVLDFRNNRNSAHLGNIDPARVDGATVMQLCAWMMGELIRLAEGLPTAEIQKVLDSLAERPITLVYEINGRPIVTSDSLKHEDIVVVLLYSQAEAIPVKLLFDWSGHTHVTRWRKQTLGKLAKEKRVFVSDEVVHLLPLGIQRAEQIIKEHEGSA